MAQWNNPNPNRKRTWFPISEEEMYAFVGLHMFCAAYRDQYQSTDHMWSAVPGHIIYKAITITFTLNYIYNTITLPYHIHLQEGGKSESLRTVRCSKYFYRI